MTTKTTSETAVELAGVTKRFGSLTAVSGLSLQIPKGTGFGFLGPNGAGKTTTTKNADGPARGGLR